MSRLMVGQTPAEQKNVSPQMTIVCTRRGKYNLGRTYISLTGFLSLISGQKDCLTSLRCLNLASLGQTTAPLCQTSVLPPYDLGKEKSCRGKISSSSFVFLSCTHVCHLAGIYIPIWISVGSNSEMSKQIDIKLNFSHFKELQKGII